MKEKINSISGYWQKLEIESSHYGEFNDDDITEALGQFDSESLDEYYIEHSLNVNELDPYELTVYDILR